jgi:hypothetical protein
LEVQMLIAGPRAFICDQYTGLSVDIIKTSNPDGSTSSSVLRRLHLRRSIRLARRNDACAVALPAEFDRARLADRSGLIVGAAQRLVPAQ